MREPSIHITRKHLKKLLREYSPAFKKRNDLDDLVNYLLKRGKIYQLSERKILESSKNKKKLTQIKQSTTQDATLFASLLIDIRRKRKHKGVALIKQNTRDWTSVHEAARLATDFCNDFNIPQRQGYINYIETVIDVLGPKFQVKLINSRHQAVCDRWNAKELLIQDNNPDLTQEAYQTYTQTIYEKTGNYIKYEGMPERYINFMYTVGIANELGLTPSQFIISQFEQLAWTKGIPTPEQITNDKARERAIRWMAENEVETADLDIGVDLREELKKARNAANSK